MVICGRFWSDLPFQFLSYLYHWTDFVSFSATENDESVLFEWLPLFWDWMFGALGWKNCPGDPVRHILVFQLWMLDWVRWKAHPEGFCHCSDHNWNFYHYIEASLGQMRSNQCQIRSNAFNSLSSAFNSLSGKFKDCMSYFSDQKLYILACCILEITCTMVEVMIVIDEIILFMILLPF